MKLRSLRLQAFGPFTNTALDFGQSASNLHIVYGANEAGKSSALRAITGLLYGIPHLSKDDHLHRKADLRVAALLENEQGEQLFLVRRKGRSNTLRDQSDASVPEGRLSAFLAGVDERLFSTLFGLNHETLRQSAQALLEGKGDLGESLFAAAGGGTHVRRVLETLRKEADALYAPRAKGRTINQILDEVVRLRSKVRQEVTEPDGYLKQKRALSEAEAERAIWHEKRRALNAERAKLSRLRAVLPWLGKRSELARELAAIGELPSLPDDSREQRVEAQRLLEGARAKVLSLELERERAREQIQAIRVPERLLQVAPELIEAVHEQYGRQRAAEADIPKREAKIRILDHELSGLLAGLSIAKSTAELDALWAADGARRVQKLREIQQEFVRVGTLAAQASASLEHNQRKLSELELLMHSEPGITAPSTTVRTASAAPAVNLEPEALRRAIARARRAGDLDQRLARAQAQLIALTSELEMGLQHLGLWAGDVAALAALNVPGAAVVEGALIRERELHEQQKRVTAGADQLQTRLVGLERDAAALQAFGPLPSLERLVSERQSRDQALLELKLLATRGAEPSAREGLAAQLAQVEKLIFASDRLSDDLRRDAERVTQLATIQRERDAAQAGLKQLQDQLARFELEQRAENAKWLDTWSAVGIQPLAPLVMKQWLERRQELLELARNHEARATEVTALIAERQQQLAELLVFGRAFGVVPAGELTLLTVIDELQAYLEQSQSHKSLHDERRRNRLALELEQQELAKAVAEFEAERGALLSEWQKLLVSLGVDAQCDLETVAVARLLEQLERLAKLRDERQQLVQRVLAMQRDGEQLAQLVASIVEQSYPALARVAYMEAAQRLVRDYRDGQLATELRARATQELARIDAAHRAESQLRDTAQAKLNTLLLHVGASDVAELERFESSWARAKAVTADLKAAEAQLYALGGGRSPAELMLEVSSISVDEIEARLLEIQSEAEEFDGALENISSTITAIQLGVERLSGNAASTAEDLEATLARLREEAEQYIKIRLGALVLEREIERYRETHQGPVLGRANELFPRLTVGRYRGIVSDFDDNDKNIIVCQMFDGTRKHVEELSDGTRDQLYLALRLATIEHFAAERGSLPLVLDDILIHSDDERAGAALEVLGEFSEKCQVLFFTHHARLVDLARGRLAPTRLCIHELPTPRHEEQGGQLRLS